MPVLTKMFFSGKPIIHQYGINVFINYHKINYKLDAQKTNENLSESIAVVVRKKKICLLLPLQSNFKYVRLSDELFYNDCFKEVKLHILHTLFNIARTKLLASCIKKCLRYFELKAEQNLAFRKIRK